MNGSRMTIDMSHVCLKNGIRMRAVRGRTTVPSTIMAGKGFGDQGDEMNESRKAAQLKVSKRGKVASRPSQQKQLERLQQEEQEYAAMMKARQEEIQMKNNAASTSYENDEDVVVPTQITDRMLKRMVMFSIGPVFLGFLLFPAFYYLKKVQGIDLPVWAVYIVQTAIFGGGLLGISYGVISSSWDPKREGSLLGWNEFQTNLPSVLDRFRKD